MTPPSKSIFLYKLFGMAVRSEIEFPEFTVLKPDEVAITAQPWVDVVYADIAETLEDSFKVATWIDATKTACLFHVADKFRILVSHGNQLAVDMQSGVPLSDVRPYLTTCGFATLAFQNQFIPLHVSAVETPQGVWLFTGPSGAGKSTLSVALSQHLGWPLLGDDLAVLQFKDQAIFASHSLCHFGVNKVKLWEDATQILAINSQSLEQDFFRPHKFHLPIAQGRNAIKLSEVTAIVQLAWGADGQEAEIAPMSAANGFMTLMNAIYPPYIASIYLDIAVVRAAFFMFAEGLQGFTLSRPKADGSLDAGIKLIHAKGS